jgi:hypothetical protein
MGSLEQAGVFLGDVSRKNPYNHKGNCENMKIMALHDALLLSNGGSWHSPPSKVIWSEEHKATRDKIIMDYEGAPCWGFKDPRTLFTLDGWMEVLHSINLIGIFRNPRFTAQSLQSRDGFSIERGLDLWFRYNERLLSYYDKYKFPIISFDTDENIFRNKLAQLIKKIGLSALGRKLNFFDPSLRGTERRHIELPVHVWEVYEKLNRVAL